MFSLRDKKIAKKIIAKLKKMNIQARFMHVCGTHQDTLVRQGLDSMLRDCGIEIGQGPGCPVCVTTPREIEEMILLAKNDKIIASFGDMLQVPSKNHSLQDLKTEGYDVRTVYGIEDSVKIAKKNPDEEVVFMAVGFETTAPSTASVMLNTPPDNFSILCCHRTMPHALKAILDMGEIKIDGLIEPGHVSTIIGTHPYEFISDDYKIPQVVAGFEPLDILMAVWMLVKQIKEKEAFVQNEYTRAVHTNGNTQAQKAIKEAFVPIDIRWRGFPVISKSGLGIKKEFKDFDAHKKYYDILKEIKNKDFSEPPGCRCGEVLRGIIKSKECPLFGNKCTPTSPVGPCMVSAEGSCNIDFRFVKKR